MENKRKEERKPVVLTTVMRKVLPRGGYAVLEFKSRNLSMGGIFICTEDMSLLDLGQEAEILVDDNGQKYYEGKAVVVRSARVFTEAGTPVESGYGLMFVDPEEGLRKMLAEKLK